MSLYWFLYLFFVFILFLYIGLRFGSRLGVKIRYLNSTLNRMRFPLIDFSISLLFIIFLFRINNLNFNCKSECITDFSDDKKCGFSCLVFRCFDGKSGRFEIRKGRFSWKTASDFRCLFLWISLKCTVFRPCVQTICFSGKITPTASFNFAHKTPTDAKWSHVKPFCSILSNRFANAKEKHLSLPKTENFIEKSTTIKT